MSIIRFMSKKIEAAVHLIVFNLIIWIIAVSMLMLAWNYLVGDFFNMQKMTIPVAVGIILIRNSLTISAGNK